MHKCELTNEQLQALIDYDRKLSESLGAGTETRKHAAHLADALQELIDRRADAESEFRRIEASLAYSDASSFLECHCSWVVSDGNLPEDHEWLDLETFDPDLDEFQADAVRYLDARRLIDRHPDFPNWIQVRDEDGPRADGPLDPAPEVK